jgi:hypothetical protein
VLFNRGEVFSANASGSITDKQNVHIGAYGVGADPILRVAANNVWVITPRQLFGVLKNINVWGIAIDNPSGFSNAQGFSTNITSAFKFIGEMDSGWISYYKCSASNVAPVSLGGYAAAAVDCYTDDPFDVAGVVGIWGMNVRMCAVKGNYVNNDGRAEHCIRLQGHYKADVSHNFTKDPANTKHNLTLRGSPGLKNAAAAWVADTVYSTSGEIRYFPSEPTKIFRLVSMTGTHKSGLSEPALPATLGDKVTDNELVWMYEFEGAAPYYYMSGQANVFNNVFDSLGTTDSSAYTTAIHPQGDANYEPISDILWHGNFYTRNGKAATQARYGLVIQGSHVTVRNNVFNMTNPSTGIVSVAIVVLTSNSAGIPLPIDVVIENNSLYSGSSGIDNNKYVAFASFSSSTATGMVVKNNLGWVPNNTSTQTVMVKTAGAVISEGNNSTTTQLRNELFNPFAGATFDTVDDFKLASGANYARAGGLNLDGVYLDFFGAVRNRASIDIGAISKDS